MAAEISFSLSEQDYVDAARGQYWHRVKSPKQWAWAFAALAVMSGLFAYAGSCDLESLVYDALSFAAVVLLICPLFATLGYLWTGRYARRMFRQQPGQPENRLSWDDDGLRIDSALGSLNAKWGDFFSWRRSGRTYMIHMNEALYYLIPGRALSAEQAADLESTLELHGVAQR